jgi:hypothetical protein
MILAFENQFKAFLSCSISLNETNINPLSAELNPICHLLALLAHNIFHISGIRVKNDIYTKEH